MSKSVVFIEKCRVFACFLGKVGCWPPRLECTTYYIIPIYSLLLWIALALLALLEDGPRIGGYIHTYLHICLTRQLTKSLARLLLDERNVGC